MTCNRTLHGKRQRSHVLLLATSFSLWIASPVGHANEVTDFWRGVQAKPAAAQPPVPPTGTPAAPAATVPSAVVNAAESKLAISAMRDEQTRLSAESSARDQASLAQTAAENERLRLASQAPTAVAPAVQRPAPIPPTLDLNLPDPRRISEPASSTPPSKSLKDKRAGLLAQMLQDGPNRENATSSMSEASLRQALSEALRQAAERTPQMKQIYAEYLAAEADVAQAKGQRWPQISVTGQTREHYLGSNRDTQYNPGNAVGLNVTTTLFDWGQTRKTIDSRKQLAVANDEHYQAQLEELAFQVTNTVLELARQRTIVDLDQHYVDRMRRLTQMLTEIVQADRGRASELTQAQARLLQAETNRDDAAAKARDAELALRKLVGDTPIQTPDSSIWPIPKANLAQLLKKVDDHPAVLQAKAQANAADLNAEATRASSKPKLAWVVSGNTGRDEVGLKQPWATMLTVSWPIFSGGSQRAASEAAQYRADAQWQSAAQQSLDLEYQVRTADENARTAFQRAADYDQLAAQTDTIRKGFFEQWFQLGQRSLLDVLSAESEYYNNRIGEVSSRFDAYQAVMRERASAGDLVNWLVDMRVE